MANELTKLEFSLEDKVNGQPLSLTTVDLPTLRSFLEDVEKLIKGDVSGATLNDSRVSLENGSVKIVTLVAFLLAADFRADIAKLEKTEDLDCIQPSRAKVIETWQSRAQRSPNRSYSVRPDLSNRPLRVTSQSEFQHGSENAWVSVEKYLTGKLVNAGGKQDPNIHLVLADTGESVRISATEQQLASERENQLYKEVTLQVQGEQHLRTKELRNLHLIQFSLQTVEVDEQALASLWRKGREAWKDVKSAAGWVEALRGNK